MVTHQNDQQVAVSFSLLHHVLPEQRGGSALHTPPSHTASAAPSSWKPWKQLYRAVSFPDLEENRKSPLSTGRGGPHSRRSETSAVCAVSALNV